MTPVHDPAPGPVVVRVLEDRDREDDVVGGDRLAVVPVSVGPEMERPGLAVRGRLPRPGELAARAAPSASIVDETLEDERDEVAIGLRPRARAG